MEQAGDVLVARERTQKIQHTGHNDDHANQPRNRGVDRELGQGPQRKTSKNKGDNQLDQHIGQVRLKEASEQCA